MRSDHVAVEWRREEARRARQRPDARLAIDHDRRAIEGERVDRTDAARGGQELHGRIDLEGLDRQGQRQRNGALASIGQGVAGQQAGILRITARKRIDLEPPGLGRRGGGGRVRAIRGGRRGAIGPVGRCSRAVQDHSRYRQVAFGEDLADAGAGPVPGRRAGLATGLRLRVSMGVAIMSVDDERRDRESATRHFDCAVLADQPAVVPAIEADQGPVGLLARESAREPARRRHVRECLQECIAARAEGEAPDLDGRQSECPARTVGHRDAQVARLGLGQVQRIDAAVARHHLSQGLPAAPVVGDLDVVAAGKDLRQPVQDQPAEFARPAEIGGDRLWLAAGLAAPFRTRARHPVEQGRRHPARTGAKFRPRPRSRRDFAFAEAQVVDADFAPAAGVC